MTNRDWTEIENELNGLVPGLPLPGLPRGEKTTSRNHSIRETIQTDEQALLAHIADALVQEIEY